MPFPPVRLCLPPDWTPTLTSTPALLAFRIWNINHQREKATRAPTGLNSRSVTAPIVRIVLESGAINAAFLFAFVMMLVENSPSLELVSNMVCLSVFYPLILKY